MVEAMTKDDFFHIRNNLETYWGDRYAIFEPLHHPMFWYNFGNTAFVIRDDEEIVAYLLGHFSQREPHAYVHMINVKSSYQGNGFGRKLYDRFIAIARENRCTSIGAITSINNKQSIAFHTRLGMRLQGNVTVDGVPVVKDYAGRGEDRVVFRMEI